MIRFYFNHELVKASKNKTYVIFWDFNIKSHVIIIGYE